MSRISRRKTSRLAVLLSTSVLVSPAFAQDDEIIVTAQKRAENLQDVPISIQAVGEQKLDDLQVSEFVDYARYLPSVAYQTAGPGFSTIYFRGVASGENSNHSASLPSVGIYLDEQPITTITGALDIHMYDVKQVEAYAGPQGTLYGASSQAGTIKIVANKPSTEGFEGGYGFEVNRFAPDNSKGGTGGVLEGFVNIPLSDNAAVRIVGWARRDGGYIDNELGSITYPSSGITDDNADLADDDYNDVVTYGGRAALKIDLDESWSITPGIMGQVQKSDGFFGFDPAAGDLNVSHFNPESSDDSWIQASLTVEGKLGIFDAIYAGAYLDRNVDTESDYSDYAYFYDAISGYGVFFYDNAFNLINPSQFIQGFDRYTKQSHEFRITSPSENRLRFIGGLFYQRQTHNIEQNYIIRDLNDGIAISTKPDNIWLTKQLRIDRDYAIFGELAFDITDRLTATGGVRVFHYDNTLEGFFGFGAGYSGSTGEAACFSADAIDGAPCTNLDKGTKDTDFIHKLNLAYDLADNALIYATWSRGFRPGGINRRGTLDPYLPDYLDNYEVGWKTTFADGMVRFNGAAYLQQWSDIQFSFLGANGLTEIRNAGDANIWGAELDLALQPTDNFTLSVSGAYNEAHLTKDYCRIANPAFDCTFQPPGTPPPTNATLAPDGTRLPITPKLKANVIARYGFNIGSLDAHLQGALVAQTDAKSDLRIVNREILGDQPGYASVDLSAGVGKDNWSLEIYADNVFDKRGDIFRFTQCNEPICGDEADVTASGGRVYTVPIKPRLIGIKFSNRF
ncbi:MAG: TonB-dependent receptor [Parvularculaceae bacterium]|nr:TonB-dependent receptor [Parvularculaceae bacterium]